MRLPEKISKLNERIEALEKRIEELEKKVSTHKVDQIGFEVDSSSSMDLAEEWDDTGSVPSIHWESDKNGKKI